ncbi:MAG: hypothetical protein BM565_12295, partial [Gammaproteobacteria bacterium MedPE]
ADDIDALLDGANETVDADDIDALLDGANETVDADDIDSLLAETDTLVEEDVIEPAAEVAADDIDALLAETDTLVEEDAIEPAAEVAADDIDALLAETDTLVEEDVIEPAAEVAVDDIDALMAESDIEPLPLEVEDDASIVSPETIDDLLGDMDSLLSESDDEAPLSTLEQLSQLDQVEQPYLMTEDALDEFETDNTLQESEPTQQIDSAPSALSQAIEPLDTVDTSLPDSSDVNTDVPSELAPSQEAQHLVDALDNMLGTAEASLTEPATQELDEFINSQAIALDDNDLAQNMAEFDEDSVIEPVTESSQEQVAPAAVMDESEAFTEIDESKPSIDLIDAEAELNEQLPKFEQENSFIDIDKLLDESAMNEQESEPYQNVDLDIGLDEFPEMLPEADGVDVDDDPNGASKKLDLARAYLEIDDEDSARDMLEQVKQTGDSAQVKEVEKLMKRLK